MASIFQSSVVTRHRASYSAFHAGSLIAQDFRMTLTSQMANGDIVEMARLQTDMLVVGAKLILTGFADGGTIKFDVGILNGEYARKDPTRICGAELFPAVAPVAAGSVLYMNQPLGFQQEAKEYDRGIGLSLSAGFSGTQTQPFTPVGEVLLILECIQKGVL